MLSCPNRMRNVEEKRSGELSWCATVCSAESSMSSLEEQAARMQCARVHVYLSQASVGLVGHKMRKSAARRGAPSSPADSPSSPSGWPCKGARVYNGSRKRVDRLGRRDPAARVRLGGGTARCFGSTPRRPRGPSRATGSRSRQQGQRKGQGGARVGARPQTRERSRPQGQSTFWFRRCISSPIGTRAGAHCT